MRLPFLCIFRGARVLASGSSESEGWQGLWGHASSLRSIEKLDGNGWGVSLKKCLSGNFKLIAWIILDWYMTRGWWRLKPKQIFDMISQTDANSAIMIDTTVREIWFGLGEWDKNDKKRFSSCIGSRWTCWHSHALSLFARTLCSLMFALLSRRSLRCKENWYIYYDIYILYVELLVSSTSIHLPPTLRNE